MKSPTKTTTTAGQVLLYVPNLIGYGRVICTIGSFVLMTASPSHWLLSIALYISSFVGDLFDGLIARKLNQTSEFGGLLDMVTDRCSTMGLLFILSADYQDYDARTFGFPVLRLTFLALALLDISSHWCQMYSTCALGQHHKSEDGNTGRHFLVRWFYKYYYFFGYLCCGAEFSYVCAYLLLHVEDGTMLRDAIVLFLCLCIPGCVMKQAVNVMQLSSACYAVAKHDADGKNK